MARGRIISRTLGTSRKFAALTGRLGEFSAALFPLLVAWSDDFGRLEGDAFTVKHRVWPTSVRPEKDFQESLKILDRVGLIELYTVESQQFVVITAFDDHQYLNRKRTTSKFPDPPTFVEFPVVPNGAGASPTGVYLKKYQALYRKIQGQPYLGNTTTQKTKDLHAAHEMCEAYRADDLLKMTEFFLNIDPEKHAKAKFMAGQQRTLPMMKSLVGDIAKHLKIRAVT